MKAYCSSFLFVCLLSIALLPVASQADTIFSDSFESADKSATNTDGFKWSQVGRIVTMNPGPVTVWRSGQSVYEPGPAGEDWTARDQAHSMMFDYLAGENWREQRFNLGTPQRDVWIRYWLRVPTNFSHGTSDPSNHKLFAIFMDDYSSKGDGPTVIWEFWRRSNPNGSRLAVHWSEGGYTVAGPHLQYTDFIYQEQDRGRWMELIFHVKAATNATSNDGVIELWRRWADESSFTKFHEVYNANIAAPAGGPNGWQRGYLMGWANAPYAQDTYWLLDKFTLSTTPFTDVAGTSSEPRAPSNVQIRAAN
jgi:hypothetical protein